MSASSPAPERSSMSVSAPRATSEGTLRAIGGGGGGGRAASDALAGLEVEVVGRFPGIGGGPSRRSEALGGSLPVSEGLSSAVVGLVEDGG